jgi:hypothetical protein
LTWRGGAQCEARAAHDARRERGCETLGADDAQREARARSTSLLFFFLFWASRGATEVAIRASTLVMSNIVTGGLNRHVISR